MESKFPIVATPLSVSQREVAIDTLLALSAQYITAGNLVDSLTILQGIISGMNECANQSPQEQNQMNVLVNQTITIVNLFLSGTGGRADLVPNTIVIFNIWSMAGQKACNLTLEVWNLLGQICISKTFGGIASSALNN